MRSLSLAAVTQAGATDDGEIAAIGLTATDEDLMLLVPRELQASFETAVAAAIRLATDRRREAFKGEANAALLAPPEMLPAQKWAVLVKRGPERVEIVAQLELTNGIQYNFPLTLEAAHDLGRSLMETSAKAKSAPGKPPTLQ